MSWRFHDKPIVSERLFSSVCYLTGGIAGIVYIIFSGSRSQSNFFRFHFLQSIVLAILAFLFGWGEQILLGLLGNFLSLLNGISAGNGVVIFQGLTWGLRVVLSAFYLLPIYGLIWALLGKYAEIPFISELVRKQLH